MKFTSSSTARRSFGFVSVARLTPDAPAGEAHGAEPETVDGEIPADVDGAGSGSGDGAHGPIMDPEPPEATRRGVLRGWAPTWRAGARRWAARRARRHPRSPGPWPRSRRAGSRPARRGTTARDEAPARPPPHSRRTAW